MKRLGMTIIGYTYLADIYCPACIASVVTAQPEYEGWALAPSVAMTTEANLDEIAYHFQIDRDNEHSFDMAAFPKVVFADAADEERCAECHEYLDGRESPDTVLNRVDGHWYVMTYGRAPYSIHAQDCATCGADDPDVDGEPEEPDPDGPLKGAFVALSNYPGAAYVVLADFHETEMLTVRAVGDDRRETVHVSHASRLDPDGFCRGCGSTVCGHDRAWDGE
jgi:hypothetical protein